MHMQSLHGPPELQAYLSLIGLCEIERGPFLRRLPAFLSGIRLAVIANHDRTKTDEVEKESPISESGCGTLMCGKVDRLRASKLSLPCRSE